MKCPFCQAQENRVIDSRLAADGTAIRRRRECSECGRRFTTYERVEEALPMVVKKDGSREAFNRAKVLQGIQKACEKRPVSPDEMEEMVDDLERELQGMGENEVSWSFLGERVLESLRDVDGVAYVRFVSVYKSFDHVSEFYEELKHLLGEELGDLPGGPP